MTAEIKMTPNITAVNKDPQKINAPPKFRRGLAKQGPRYGAAGRVQEGRSNSWPRRLVPQNCLVGEKATRVPAPWQHLVVPGGRPSRRRDHPRGPCFLGKGSPLADLRTHGTHARSSSCSAKGVAEWLRVARPGRGGRCRSLQRAVRIAAA